MSEQGFKVTDKRMFTPEGELREEFRSMGEETAAAKGSETNPPGREDSHGEAQQVPGPESWPGSWPESWPESQSASQPESQSRVPLEIPQAGAGLSFLDLVATLAEPVPIFLGDAPMADGSQQKDLEMARLHIDLLDVVRRKTVGNLSAQESRVLEDVFYQLRMRYVQQQG